MSKTETPGIETLVSSASRFRLVEVVSRGQAGFFGAAGESDLAIRPELSDGVYMESCSPSTWLL